MNRRNSIRRRLDPTKPVLIKNTGKGFSMIEILVVLVILLIGILAILRLFPGGFLTIARTGEMTAAQALADQQLSDERNAASISTAAASALPNNNGDIVLINGVRADDTNDSSANDLTALTTQYGFQLPNNYSPYYFSNINKIRYVIGETLHIPMASPNTINSTTPVYTLQYGPVYNVFGTDPNTNDNKDSIQVYGANLTRVLTDSTMVSGTNLATVLPDGTYYAIDYAKNLIAFYPRPTGTVSGVSYRLFKFTAVTYRPAQSSGGTIIDRTNTTIETNFTIRVNDSANAVWQPIPLTDCNGNDISSTGHIWPNTEQISRKFRLVSTSTGSGAPFASADPYEYAWYSGQLSANTNANMGTLIFNPAAHIVNPGAGGTSAIDPADAQLASATGSLVVHIDYLTYDNHIIRDNRTMPGAAPYNIRLSLPYIQTNGDILPDQSTYDGIFHEAAAGSSPDLILYNATTGTIVGEIGGGITATTSQANGWVTGTLDSLTGLLSLDTTTANGTGVEDLKLQSIALRVLYRTQKDYGMQIQQATAQYVPVPDPTCLDYRSYYIGGSAGASGTAGGSQNTVYFDVSQAGKTVNIGEYYTVPTSGGTVTPTRFTNQTFQISDNPANFQQLNGKLYATLTVAAGTQFDSTTTGLAINNMQGASLKSRILWKSAQRWRKVDNDTVLQANSQ